MRKPVPLPNPKKPGKKKKPGGPPKRKPRKPKKELPKSPKKKK